MREILFRAKDTYNNNDWVYGDLYHNQAETMIIEQPSGNETDVDKNTLGQYTGLTDKNGKKIFEGDIVEVYAQRSVYGRKQSVEDKYIKVRALVKFSLKNWCGIGFDLNYENNYNKQLCKPKNKEENERQLNTYYLSNYAVKHIRHEKWKFLDDIEIIGNIYDNPELLEEE